VQAGLIVDQPHVHAPKSARWSGSGQRAKRGSLRSASLRAAFPGGESDHSEEMRREKQREC